MIKLWLDTDIGDDIDDALALAYLIKLNAFDLVGISTCFEDTVKRAKIAKQIVVTAGLQHIPVYPGSGDPLGYPLEAMQTPHHYMPVLHEGMKVEKPFQAVAALAAALDAHNGELAVVAIGALTNIALLIKTYPESAKKMKRLVWMGGMFYDHFITWNASMDVEAVAVVFDSGLLTRVLSRDVCGDIELPRSYCEALAGSGDPLSATLGEQIRYWFASHHRLPILFDPLTLYAALDEYPMLRFRAERVLVETKGFTRGLTFRVTADYSKFRTIPPRHAFPPMEKLPLVEVSCQVDSKAYVRHFMEVLAP